MSGIYKILNVVNQKYYVGSSSNIEGKRWPFHKRLLNLGIHFNTHLQAAWNKYGCENFKLVVLENVDRVHLINKEQEYLNIAKLEKQNCYNQTFTAGRVDWNPTLRRRMSVITKQRLKNPKNHGMFGKFHSNESKKKMSLSKQGKHLSEEAKKKISGVLSVAHRIDVKNAKINWWKKLRSNPIEYKKFCVSRAEKSVAARKKKYEELYEITQT
jgi:group I intron endonuclease